MILFKGNSIEVEGKDGAIYWTAIASATDPDEWAKSFENAIPYANLVPGTPWFIDVTRKKKIMPEYPLWLVENVNPKLNQSKEIRLAFLNPSYDLERAIIYTYRSYTCLRGDNINIQIFDDMDSAQEWAYKAQLAKVA